MPTDLQTFLTQALGVSAIVTGLLLLTRRGGTLVAGLATAALSAPTLVLLALHEGAAFARLAALGMLLSTPVCAGLAALGLRWLARGTAQPADARPCRAWLTPALAGLMSASVCALAQTLGPVGSGFVGGLPLVAAWTMLGTRRHSGSGAAVRYLRAFGHGLLPRGVMGLGFAAGAVPLGAAEAMSLALAASALVACWGPLRGAVRRRARPELPSPFLQPDPRKAGVR